jgi:hypothetical protein
LIIIFSIALATRINDLQASLPSKKFEKEKKQSLERDLNPASYILFHTQEPNHSATNAVAAGTCCFTYYNNGLTLETNPANY